MADVAQGVDPNAERIFTRLAEAVDAGDPVVVRHGYEIDLLPPYSGPWCVEPDGSLTAVEPVYDPNAAMATVTGYRRPDGSMV
jgi:hypothetical protein